MEDTFIYTFVDGILTNAIIVARNGHDDTLVYATLGKNKAKLLSDARCVFDKGFKRLKKTYKLEVDGSGALNDLSTIYAKLLDGESYPEIKYEFLFGTPFQHKVWKEIAKVKPGTTTNYGTIAKSIGISNGSRAVGGAVGKNKLALVIPCNRVIGKNGADTGFEWGLELKRELLKREKVFITEI